ncbi:MAG: hypothetical protein ABEH35_02420 [Haloarculaceae archaeon]
MTTVAVLADPPFEGFVLPALADGPLSEADAANLYEAMLADVCRAVEASGAELLVNVRPDEQVPGDDSERAIREAVEPHLEQPADARFEVQVGSTKSARAGNTVTHLLEREGVQTAAVVEPSGAFLARQQIDSAAMKLRSEDVVLGPSTDGRVYYAGFREPIDFTDAFETPTVETLVERAREADLSVGFLPTVPVIERPADLHTAIPQLRARRAAGRRVPERTAERIETLGLRVVEENGAPALARQ